MPTGKFVPNPGVFRREDNSNERTVVQCTRCGTDCYLGDRYNAPSAQCPGCGKVPFQETRMNTILRGDRFAGMRKKN